MKYIEKQGMIIHAYYNTYDKEFEPDTINVVGVKEDVDNFLREELCSALEEDCKKYKNECLKCVANKYNLDIVYN